MYNGTVYGNDSILDVWATYLCVPANTHLTSEQLQVVESYLQIQSLPADAPDPISEEEVAAVIHSLPLKKAVGPDKLSYEHLKFGGTACATCHSNKII